MFKHSTIIIMFWLILSISVATMGVAQQKIQLEGSLAGAGIIVQTFDEVDDFRKATGLFGNTDQMDQMAGYQLFVEFFVGSGFSLGIMMQPLSRTVTYSTTAYDLDRTVSITNGLGYANLFLGFGDKDYFSLGVNLGLGLSTYKYEITCENNPGYSLCSSSSSSSDSVDGTMSQIGAYFDWGGEAFGGRIGYKTVSASYPDMDNATPKGNGSQSYFDIRYIF